MEFMHNYGSWQHDRHKNISWFLPLLHLGIHELVLLNLFEGGRRIWYWLIWYYWLFRHDRITVMRYEKHWFDRKNVLQFPSYTFVILLEKSEGCMVNLYLKQPETVIDSIEQVTLCDQKELFHVPIVQCGVCSWSLPISHGK